jgi:hypothetical protein
VLAIDWNWLSLAVEMNGTSGAATSELALTCGSQTTTRMVACACVEQPKGDDQPATCIVDGELPDGVYGRRGRC